jgi:hypothetical protein
MDKICVGMLSCVGPCWVVPPTTLYMAAATCLVSALRSSDLQLTHPLIPVDTTGITI